MKIICFCFLFVILCVSAVEETQDEFVDPKSTCYLRCPRIPVKTFSPVCGFNNQCYKLFSNKCLMEGYNCQYDENYHEVDICYCKGQLENECDKQHKTDS